ncbi:MAG: lysophospholipid acyltransferase family protein [Gemmatimonadales bacterium]|nr:1-acyl-sn-glycerol-3-phosphate acyltransferase [Gemmatimonadota bacterium]MCB9518502.1 1-acyl-sn-glycerol-3-phosphate acyltransferase [Gemmatimonadales bacterium]HPF61392.1 lysophospholipid acyltransferase family protein [Gemmatimonadales bacterium]HRX17644.1 lysophospholipid acyltransferase family protein [Gemmatimonadales bacterium]
MRSRLVDTLASIWTWSVLAVCTALYFPPILVWRILGWPVDRWNYLGGRLFRSIAIPMVGLTPRWRFEIRGTPPANPRLPYVVIANHESFADIILLSLLPWEMKWLSKVSIMRIPVFGWIMWAARDVPVHRGLAASARAAMAECRRRLDGKVSVMIFPEGTRSKTRDLLPFKDGAFRLAIDTQSPILPIAVYGTRQAIAKHDWRIGRAHAVAEILEPVPTAGLEPKDLQRLKREVQATVEAARERLRAELEAEAGGRLDD